jgi:hypothetical protein
MFYCVRIAWARAREMAEPASSRERERETFFFVPASQFSYGQFIASVVSSYKRDENKRTEAIGTRRSIDATLVPFFYALRNFPRVFFSFFFLERCACITNVHRAAQRSPISMEWCKISNIKNCTMRRGHGPTFSLAVLVQGSR